MYKKMIPVLLASSVVLSGCLEQNSPGTTNSSAAPATLAVKKENAVASVNGIYISKETLNNLEMEIMQRTRGQAIPKDKLIEELVQRELLAQQATAIKLENSPEFLKQLHNIKQSLLSQAALKYYIDNNPLTDDALKAEYEAKMGVQKTEYKARHILVKTEDEAKAVIAELAQGADFSELAKTKSTGPSGPQGGDLGWFTADRMVPPFSEAVIALENGKSTAAPVQTQFGWHVILREESREQTPPPFESVKEQIRPMLQRQQIQDYMADLRAKAKVEILTDAPEAADPTPEPVVETPAEPAAE